MTHLVDVTIDSTKVGADATDFDVFIDLSDMPANFWSTVTNGGGDIRCYKSDGTTQLARTVESCDTSTETGRLAVKYAGTLSSTVDTVIQIHADGTSTEPTSTSTYGRNNTWTTYDRVYWLSESSGSFIDYTGSGNDGTATGTLTRNTTIGNFEGVDLGATSSHSNYVDCATTSNNSVTNTTSVWLNLDSTQSNFVAVVADGDSVANVYAPLQRNGTSNDAIYYYNRNSSYDGVGAWADFADGSNHLVHAVYDNTATEVTWYVDGSQSAFDGTPDSVGGSISVSPTLKLGNSRTGSNGASGAIALVKIAPSARAGTWVSTEYNNQNSPDTFYTVTAVGGVTAKPYGAHLIDRQYASIAANRLGGVIQ